MAYTASPLPVTIIPACVIQSDRTVLRRLERDYADALPINYAYYTVPRRYDSTVYSLPRSQYIDDSEQRVHWAPPTRRRGRPQAYPPSGFSTFTWQSNKSVSSNKVSELRAFSGPYKYPEPLYKKTAPADDRRLINNNNNATGFTIERTSARIGPQPCARRSRRNGNEHGDDQGAPPTASYNIWLRFALKVAQLVFGAITLACIMAPSKSTPLYVYLASTKSQGQIFAVAVTSLGLIVTSLLVLTIFMSQRSRSWRHLDALASILLVVLYTASTGLEIWYAACYPPLGKAHHQGGCPMTVWIVAAIFSVFNLVVYSVDLILSLVQGVSLF